MAKGQIVVNVEKVKSKCNSITDELAKINKCLNGISSEVENMQKNKIWVGGTRSVARYKDLNDTIANSNKVVSSISGVVNDVMTAVSGIGKSV